MIKLSDYLIGFIESIGVGHIFLISGGGNIHIVDSLGKSKRIKYVCNHHEQASATAAEAYARITGKIGACLVTTGPGGTNAITGVLGAWLDSIPILVISGQVKRETIGAGIVTRQLGDQEINIIDIVKPLTKYAVTVMEPEDIRYILEKAVYIATTGRQGPVWVDIPLDIQGSFIDEKNLKGFKQLEVTTQVDTDQELLKKIVGQTLEKLKNSKRPVIYAGNGIRLSGAEKDFLYLVKLLKIPVLTSYAGYDLVTSDNPFFFGRAHAFGQRAANFILQNSDYLLSIGARLDIRTIGFTYKAFAREAYHVMVDIDRQELNKKILSPDLKVNFDAGVFVREMIKQIKERHSDQVKRVEESSIIVVEGKIPRLALDKLKLVRDGWPEWLDYGRRLNKKYPVVLPEFWKEKKAVNPYCLIETIGKLLNEGEQIILSDGVGPLNCSYQALYIKRNQRVVLNNGCAQMGYGLPAAIGVAFAHNKKKRVICFEGDGSLQMNIHELQVVKHHNLPIKLFIYDNDGYQSIKNTQNNLFSGRLVAVNRKSGVSCPDFVKIAKAYGLPVVKINNHVDMKRKIIKVLNSKGPFVCVVNTVKDLMLTPKLAAKKLPNGQFTSPPLEDMWPFLSREELKENMIIPIWEEK
jgi:acetolactate synthase-1/2/3 large subunit